MSLDSISEALAQRVAQLVLDSLRTGELAGWISQEKSPLGRRKHIALARREGRQIGRRYFLPLETVERAMGDRALLDSLKVPRPKRRSETADAESAMNAVTGK